MVAEVASAAVALLPTFKGGARAISQQLNPYMPEAGRQGGEDYGRGVLGTFTKFAAPIAAVFASAKVVEFLKSSVDAASDLNEAGTAVGQVFGDAYSKIEVFAQGAARTLGQSTLDTLDAAKTFGVFGQAAGLAGDDLVGFSTNLVQLATDLASFHNTTPEEAVEALGAALRGESEPLRRYGVLLDDATLKAAALEKGIITASVDEVKVTAARRKLTDATSDLNDALASYGDGSDEAARASEKVTAAQAALEDALGGSVGTLTPAQRTMAAYQVILEQTTVAQGDFTRTSSGLANQQRILAAQTEDFKARFGQALLPLFTSVVTSVNDQLFPALDQIVPVFTDIATSAIPTLIDMSREFGPIVTQGLELGQKVLPSVGVGFGALLDAGEPVLDFLNDLDPATLTLIGGFAGFVALRGPMTTTLTAIGAGLANLNTPFDSLNTKLDSVPKALGKVTNFLSGPWPFVIVGAGAVLLDFALSTIPQAIDNVDALTDSLDRQTGAFTDATRAAVIKALQDGGAFEQARALGINLETLTDAAMGNAAAQAQINAQMVAYKDTLEGGALNVAVQFADATGKITAQLGGQNENLNQAVQNWKDSAEASGLLKQAQDDLNASVQAAASAVAANGATLDENTVQGQANMDALQGIADKATSLIDVQIGLQASTLTVQQTMAGSRESFVQTAVAMGVPIDQAQVLADKMLSIPTQRVSDIVVNTYDALQKIDVLNSRLDSIRSRQVEVAGTSQAYGFAGGGTVWGPGTSKSDSVPAWLSVGEEVIQEPYASRHRALLKAINAGMAVNGIRGYASGGTVGSQATSTDRPIYADGIGLIGWMREVANGQAEIIWNMKGRESDMSSFMGVQA